MGNLVGKRKIVRGKNYVGRSGCQCTHEKKIKNTCFNQIIYMRPLEQPRANGAPPRVRSGFVCLHMIKATKYSSFALYI